MQRDVDAIKVAKNILRKDPDFLDVRCALTAFNWAVGARAAAEDEWQRLQARCADYVCRTWEASKHAPRHCRSYIQLA